jgi:hypothetical protein
MKKKAFLLVIFLFSHAAFSQTKKLSKKISRPEIWWALGHPFIASKAFCISREAVTVTKQVMLENVLDQDPAGGQIDAFRHGYWMARLAQEMNPRKALKLGIAHEKGNYIDFKKKRLEDGILPDKISSTMDLYNNEKGSVTGYANRTMNADSLRLLIIQQVKAGDMVIIYKDEGGNALRCNDSLINPEEFKETWDIPKCLVSSARKKER